MKLSEWLRGPVPADDPFIRLLNRVALAVILILILTSPAAAQVTLYDTVLITTDGTHSLVNPIAVPIGQALTIYAGGAICGAGQISALTGGINSTPIGNVNASSGAFTSLLLGLGGTSGVASVFTINGSTGSTLGPIILFDKNTTQIGAVGALSAILATGTSSDIALYANTGNNIDFYTNGVLNAQVLAAGGFYVPGMLTIGVGGTSVTTQGIRVNGSDAAVKGPSVELDRNGTALGYLISQNLVDGGSTNNLSVDSQLALTFYTNAGVLALTLTAAQNATFAGSITDVGTTNGAAAWKHGPSRSGSGLAVSTTTGLQVNVGGTTYTLPVLTTNP